MEDPVTGSAHCTLAPYWASRLAKTKLTAYQASSRGGELDLELANNALYITDRAVTIMKGQMLVDFGTV